MTFEEYKIRYADKREFWKRSLVSKVCTFCLHFDIDNAGEQRCEAFPNRIPLEIWAGKNDHTQPFPDDKGIRFTHFKSQS